MPPEIFMEFSARRQYSRKTTTCFSCSEQWCEGTSAFKHRRSEPIIGHLQLIVPTSSNVRNASEVPTYGPKARESQTAFYGPLVRGRRTTGLSLPGGGRGAARRPGLFGSWVREFWGSIRFLGRMGGVPSFRSCCSPRSGAQLFVAGPVV